MIVPSFVVNTTADYSDPTDGKTSLREAIASANALPGHTIIFDPTVFASAQTITLTGSELELSDPSGTETIVGPAAGVTVSGDGLSRVFQIDGPVTAAISGLTITGGNSGQYGGGGGGLENSGAITLTNCTDSGNIASSEVSMPNLYEGSGGGLYNSGTATLTNCTVSRNDADSDGGGLFNAGTITLTKCTVSGNSASGNGGGLESVQGGNATLTSSLLAVTSPPTAAACSARARSRWRAPPSAATRPATTAAVWQTMGK